MPVFAVGVTLTAAVAGRPPDVERAQRDETPRPRTLSEHSETKRRAPRTLSEHSETKPRAPGR
jgi:hypothetical protein